MCAQRSPSPPVTDLTKTIVDLTKDESPARMNEVISLIEEVQRNDVSPARIARITQSISWFDDTQEDYTLVNTAPPCEDVYSAFLTSPTPHLPSIADLDYVLPREMNSQSQTKTQVLEQKSPRQSVYRRRR